ncbi:MAG: thiamine diphosphokinase [Pseudomonadota bacterium]
MFRPIQSPERPVTLLGGGEATGSLVNTALTFAPLLVAADGGARLARQGGHKLRAVIGDFDSLDAEDLGNAERLHRPDQNSTDFEKCLAAVEAPLFLGVGFLGGRLDHQLAAFSALLKEPRPVVLLSKTEIAFLAPRTFTLDLKEGTPVALYPLLPARLTTTGLRYPLDDAPVSPDGMTSTSNTALGGPLTVRVDRRSVLVMLPLAALGQVCAALAG